LEGTPFLIPTENLPWKRGDQPRFAGVSSFGMSGTNAHLILEEAPVPQDAERAAPAASAYLLPLSARSPAALRALAASYAETRADASIYDVAYTASVRRTHHDHRLAIVGRTREEIAAGLASFARDGAAPGISLGRVVGASRPKVVFVFPGQG